MSVQANNFNLNLPTRARQIVQEARLMLEETGWDNVTMRPLAERMNMRAPSLYKHFANRDQIKSTLVAEGLLEIGNVLHTVLENGGSGKVMLSAYRTVGLSNPNLYRLATEEKLDRENLPKGLEDWAGMPFYTVTNDQTTAQALWSFAHGTLILELDGRYPLETNIDLIWEIGVKLFVKD